MIKVIIFDLGGVLVPEKGSLIENEIADYLGIDVLRLSELTRDLKPLATQGKINLIEVYSEIIKRLEKDIKQEDLLQKHFEIYKDFSMKKDSEVLLLIENLKFRYRVVCLTNTEREIAELNRKNGLFDYFERAYISVDMGLMKPELEIYKRVLEDLGCLAEECLFIDDKLEYVEAAKKVGMNAIKFENLEQLKIDLQKELKYD